MASRNKVCLLLGLLGCQNLQLLFALVVACQATGFSHGEEVSGRVAYSGNRKEAEGSPPPPSPFPCLLHAMVSFPWRPGCWCCRLCSVQSWKFSPPYFFLLRSLACTPLVYFQTSRPCTSFLKQIFQPEGTQKGRFSLGFQSATFFPGELLFGDDISQWPPFLPPCLLSVFQELGLSFCLLKMIHCLL